MQIPKPIKPNTSGIYKITNLINKCFYIGSSINIYHRCMTHSNSHLKSLRKNKHCNPHLQAAWNKYGEDNFQLEVLLICSPIKEQLLFYEQICFNLSGNKYNILKVAGSTFGRYISKETRQKLSKSKLGNKNPNYGKNFSIDIRKNMSAAHKGKIPSLETRQKISASKVKHKIQSLNPVTNEIVIYESYNSVKQDGFIVGNVWRCCHKQRKSHKGLLWKEI